MARQEWGQALVAAHARNCVEVAKDRLIRREQHRTESHPQPCHLLRDIFGNPFRPAIADPVWLAWEDGTVPALAQSIYDERAFDRLPILSDALEEAGCTNTDILGHCRQPGQHVPGCWVVDLVLGKK